MDLDNPVVKLCMQGREMEIAGRDTEARELFLQAWQAAQDDYHACVAAHYVARHQQTLQEVLHWNTECLNRADLVGDDRVRGFYAALHTCLGHAQLELGLRDEAREQFRAAAGCLDDVLEGAYRDGLRYGIGQGCALPAPPR